MTGPEVIIWIPCWWVLLVTLPLPALLLVQRIRTRRRRRDGLCPTCGYDLRAPPDRCPECGAVSAPPHQPRMQRTAAEEAGTVT